MGSYGALGVNRCMFDEAGRSSFLGHEARLLKFFELTNSHLGLFLLQKGVSIYFAELSPTCVMVA